MVMKTLSISRIRTKLGLSQAELAERLGVNQSTVQRWVKGKPISGPASKLLEQMVKT